VVSFSSLEQDEADCGILFSGRIQTVHVGKSLNAYIPTKMEAIMKTSNDEKRSFFIEKKLNEYLVFFYNKDRKILDAGCLILSSNISP